MTSGYSEIELFFVNYYSGGSMSNMYPSERHSLWNVTIMRLLYIIIGTLLYPAWLTIQPYVVLYRGATDDLIHVISAHFQTQEKTGRPKRPLAKKPAEPRPPEIISLPSPEEVMSEAKVVDVAAARAGPSASKPTARIQAHNTASPLVQSKPRPRAAGEGKPKQAHSEDNRAAKPGVQKCPESSDLVGDAALGALPINFDCK